MGASPDVHVGADMFLRSCEGENEEKAVDCGGKGFRGGGGRSCPWSSSQSELPIPQSTLSEVSRIEEEKENELVVPDPTPLSASFMMKWSSCLKRRGDQCPCVL
jgi:hypothetical protein